MFSIFLRLSKKNLKPFSSFLTITLFVFCSLQNLNGQNISFNNSVPSDLTVCEETEIFTVEFVNISAGVLSNVVIHLEMPEGINYEPGSIIENSSLNVQEQDISNLSDPYFSSNDISNNQTLSFSFEASADFVAYTNQNAGNVFNNIITVEYDGFSESETTAPYNILFGALSITDVSPMSTTAFVGGTYIRVVSIANGGYGSISSFVLEDIHDANSTLDAVNLGTINAEGSAITFTSSDFTTIGNGDGYFDQNEVIVVEQKIGIAACDDFQSTLSAYWGCTGETTYSNVKKPQTNVVLYAPDLLFEATPSFNTCVDGSPDNQQLKITNSGTGPANELEIEIDPGHDKQVSAIDISSITLSLNGNSPSSITPIATEAAHTFSCLGTDPRDGFTLAIPPLQPGETIVLNWDTYTCATNTCGNVRLIGWEYEAVYTDMCNSKDYEDKGDGQEEKRKNIQTFFEYPTNLRDQEEGLYTLIFHSAIFDMPEEDGAYFEIEYDIPLGLVWNGNASDLDLAYTSGSTEWMPSDIAYNNASRKLTAKYAMPIPDDFSLIHSTFDLNLTADCSEGGGDANVKAQVYYVMNPSCDPLYRMRLACPQDGVTKLFCPGNCEHGLAFENFEIERVSLGISDNDQDGLPDDVDAPDFSKIKTNRVMVGDIFQTVFEGTIHTSAIYPSWDYAYARSEMPYGNEIDVASAEVIIKDASTGQTLTCDQVSFTHTMSGSVKIVDFDFSPSTLAANGCTDFLGFVLEEDDKIILNVKYKVTGNPGGIIEQVVVENDFYVSDTENAPGFQCYDWNDNFTLVGYYYEVTTSDNFKVTSCTKTINQNFKMSIGTCCTNYGGGDIFPYEYRNWAHAKTLKVNIPDGYAFDYGRIRQWRTESSNKTVKETHNNIQPESIDGNTYTFNLENYYKMNGGNLNLSDDGFHGKVFIIVKPECTVDETISSPVTWTYTFQENDILGGSETEEYEIAPDNLTYIRADLDLSTTFQTQQVTGSTVSWDIEVEGKNADTENAWLYLEHVDGEMEIIEVRDIDADVVIANIDGFYQIGDVDENDTKTYTVTVNYNACDLSELKVVSGYDCAGYPTSLDAYSCSYNEMMLYIEPQETELQVKFNAELLGNVDCSDYISVEFEMLSAKLSTVENIFVNIIQPNSRTIEMVPGTVEVLYPESGNYSPISDPILEEYTYSISGAEMDSEIGTNGLVGITDVTANRVKLKFSVFLTPDFQSGDVLSVLIGGDEACGNPLPNLSLTIDPNASFRKVSSIGIDELGDDWSTSWGDFDNDGFVDFFVTDYRADWPNRLYRNQGDGTFDQVITGAIVTDLATSLASTWGDYDNDGDLDLFVSNNIGFKNFLYRNNGDATFTKILNDPIVNYDGYSHGVSWIDYDNDGFIDLFVTDYFSTRFNHLYHNNGDGTFTDANSLLPSLESSSSLGSAWADYDNDGFIDLFVGNINNENNSLYKNTGNGGFIKITNGDIVNDGGNSVGASWGDYNNDGNIDLFVSNAGNQDNFLYTNNGDGTFTKVTDGDIVNDGGHSHGSAWGDYDNDGDLDLFVSNDQEGKNLLYSNNGNGTFSKLSNNITEDKEHSFGAAWADYDNDMDIDLLVINRGMNENSMYKNSRGKCQSKACVTLVGTNTNRSAIGAKVRIKATIYGEEVWQLREVTSQSGGGTGGQNDMKLIIGLGDATQIDAMMIEWPSGYTQIIEGLPIDECHTIEEDEGGEICGVAYIDANNNCVQDSLELGIPNLNIIIQPGDITLTTDENGVYSTFVAPGVYTINQGASPLWEQDCTLEHTVNVVQFGESYCGNNFANFATNPAPDLAVGISTTPHRIGFENLIALTYCNMGTVPATNVILTLTIGPGTNFNGGPNDDIVLIDSSVPWESNDGETATWSIGDLGIGESATIFVKDSIASNVAAGTLIPLTATIISNETELVIANNSDQSMEPAVGGFDPNDISVSPEGYIDNDQELIYTIRFQNVGNAAVSTVRITDQLPTELDVETLEMGVASHPYRLEVIDGNVLVWNFENINMPDSTTNEAESHGYIIFKIKPVEGLEEGATFKNDASIYFDNNEPIHTNVVVNIIGEEPKFEIADDASELLDIFPNPMSEKSMIKIVDLNGNNILMTGLNIHNIVGSEIFSKRGMLRDSYEFEKGELAPGCYLIRAIGENRKEYVGKLIIH